VRIPKHATWAWRPDTGEKKDKDAASHDRDVISRDVISDDGRSETISRDPRSDNETLRLAIRTDIEQEMRSKGFKQVDDPATAEFVADYHFAIRRHCCWGRLSQGDIAAAIRLLCAVRLVMGVHTWGYWAGHMATGIELPRRHDRV
jgi:hypothetical protein